MKSCGLWLVGYIYQCMSSLCWQLFLRNTAQGILLLCLQLLFIFKSFYPWCSVRGTNVCQKSNTLPHVSVNSQLFETSVFFVTCSCTTKTPKYSFLIVTLMLKNMENLVFGKKNSDWVLAHLNKNFKWCISLKNTIVILQLLFLLEYIK